MSDDAINERTSGGDAGESDEQEEKSSPWGVLVGMVLILALSAGVFFLVRGCQQRHGLKAGADHADAAYTGAAAGRQVVYILNSTMTNKDDHDDRLNDSAYRLDVFDLASGQRVSRTVTGGRSSRWLGSNGAIAWLVSNDRTVRLYACDVAKGGVLVRESELIEKNPGILKDSIDSVWYDPAAGAVVARSASGAYCRIDGPPFTAHPANAPATEHLTAPDIAAPFARTTALLSNGTRLDVSGTAITAERGADGPRRTFGAVSFTRAGILYDGASNTPFEPRGSGSCIVFHYKSADDDAPYMLTALDPDGRVMWTTSRDILEGAPGVRSALRFNTSLILITDSAILSLDMATGKLTRTIEF